MTQTRAEQFAVLFRLLRISSGFFLALFILLLWGRLELRTVDVHIRRLRRALNINNKPDLIRTVRSMGYALEAEKPS